MSRSLKVAFALLTLTTAACNGEKKCTDHYAAESGGAQGRGPAFDSAGEASNSAPSSSSVVSRAISEADIVQLDDEQDRIYAISRSGTLAVVDARIPRTLTLMGKTGLAGIPFEMYRRGDVLITMTNHAVLGDGQIQTPLPEDAAPPLPDTTSGAAISAIDVSNPAAMTTLATLKVPGEIADSRIVGHVLYLATYENMACWNCGAKPRTLVTTFDITEPTAPKQVDQVAFESDPNSVAWNFSSPTPWKRSIVATTNRLYVGGLAYDPETTTDEGVIEVLDISDPSGKLQHGATLTMSGPILNRWQMDESDGVLRVVSQRGAGRSENGEKFPDVDTFRIESSQSVVRIGHTTLKLPQQEGLKSVRFDGQRGYVITFLQHIERPIDPLFTIDLSDPTKPRQKGELEMPGWVFHLEPRGDRLVGLGLDRQDASGVLNVSLFDVAELTAPALIQRVSFGPRGRSYTDDMITQGIMAEDQDRIRKAFRIDRDGLISIPFSGMTACSYSADEWEGVGSGIQLIQWSNDALTTRAVLPLPGNPRRVVRRDSATSRELIGISDSHIRAFSLDSLDAPMSVAEVTIGTCVMRPVNSSGFGGGGGGDAWEGRPRGHRDLWWYDRPSCE